MSIDRLNQLLMHPYNARCESIFIDMQKQKYYIVKKNVTLQSES